MKRIILAGGGHGHVSFLKRIVELKKEYEIVLISDRKRQYYSGMLPGFIDGIYTEEQISFNLEKLCQDHEISFVQEKILTIDDESRTVITDRSSYNYDLLSMNLGSYSRNPAEYTMHPGYIPTKPVSGIVERIGELKRNAENIIIAGGGAAGTELALALPSLHDRIRITLIQKNLEIIPDYSEKARLILLDELRNKNVEVLLDEKVLKADTDGTVLTDKGKYNCTHFIDSTGYRGTGIEFRGFRTTSDNYVIVDRYLMSSPTSLAMGDMVSMEDHPALPKAGVFAIRQAPLLAENILALALGRSNLREYQPGRENILQILYLGSRRALLHKSGHTFKGRTAFLIKDFIDRYYMRQAGNRN